jgi:hypothetical protein
MKNYYFSKEDPCGDNSNLTANFYNHAYRKSHYGSWGADKHTRKLFPRGKAYDRLMDIQLDNHIDKLFEEERGFI